VRVSTFLYGPRNVVSNEPSLPQCIRVVSRILEDGVVGEKVVCSHSSVLADLDPTPIGCMTSFGTLLTGVVHEEPGQVLTKVRREDFSSDIVEQTWVTTGGGGLIGAKVMRAIGREGLVELAAVLIVNPVLIVVNP